MQKVTAAIIKQNDKVLLMRRDKNQPHAGKWEFPGGKVEPNEKLGQCIKRELREELGIEATIGDMISSVKTKDIELFAYNITGYTGEIQMRVHDKMKWVELWNINKHELLPADSQLVEKILKYPDTNALETQAHKEACKMIKTPKFDERLQLWRVNFIKNGEECHKFFFSNYDATEFYMTFVNKIIESYKRYKILNFAKNGRIYE